MIHTFAVFCMLLWPKTCQTIELVPDDGHRVASLGECMRGGMMVPAAEFAFQGEMWRLKGISCREDHDEVAEWLDRQRR